jgi:hypothetical protein
MTLIKEAVAVNPIYTGNEWTITFNFDIAAGVIFPSGGTFTMDFRKESNSSVLVTHTMTRIDDYSASATLSDTNTNSIEAGINFTLVDNIYQGKCVFAVKRTDTTPDKVIAIGLIDVVRLD